MKVNYNNFLNLKTKFRISLARLYMCMSSLKREEFERVFVSVLSLIKFQIQLLKKKTKLGIANTSFFFNVFWVLK